MNANCLVRLSGLTFLFFFGIVSAEAQIATRDLDLDSDIYRWFDQSIGSDNTGILRGSYHRVERFPGSHPLLEENWSSAQISYRGVIYDEVELIYDLYHDVPLFRHPDTHFTNSPIVLVTHLDWFRFNETRFKYYDQRIFLFPPGYYEELFSGDRIRFLVKHIKKIDIDRAARYYNKDEVYIVYFNDKFTRLKNRGSVLRLFKNNKQVKAQIKEFIKGQKLMVKEGHDSDLVQLAEYVDQMKTL